VAAGVIYYYLIQHGKKINMKEFATKVGISELTINKVVGIVRDLV
jgi:hypothetical protein